MSVDVMERTPLKSAAPLSLYLDKDAVESERYPQGGERR